VAKEHVVYNGPIVTRAAAISDGLKRYFNAKPCGYGHIAERFVSSKSCVACSSIYHDAWAGQNKARLARYAKDRRAVNPLPHRASSSACYDSNREHYLAAAKAYRADNKEKRNAWNQTRRAIKSGGAGQHTKADIDAILLEQRFRCAECGTSVRSKRNVDHIMPLKLGGTNDKRNIQILCPKCNMRKHAKHPIDWARENGRLL
jgi:5-methylcytosine-specific restriction endonuclease McrA